MLGRYELLRPLARGGMAEVFLARRRVGGVEKRLVIKRLRRDHHRDPRFLEMFVREAQLSMSLVQQNVVPVFDFGRIGDDVFLAMEYIDGKDLGSTLAQLRDTGLPPILAAFVAGECAHALDHAHGRKDPVIHRDVTPRNVLLSWAGEVKLADFGIAAVVGEVAGQFGTPGYMAPEQANGGACDGRVDVYALGIVLWESVIGDHVRPIGSRLITLAAARSGELPPISDAVPPPLAAIIACATARAPADRYASARAFSDALDGYIVAERARDPGPAPGKRLAEWLAIRWQGKRDEPAGEVAAIPGGFVTFLDDGADGVRGSHTQRSAAETADAGDGIAAEASPVPKSVERPATRSPVAAPRSRQTIALVVALVAVAGLALLVWSFAGDPRRARAVPPDGRAAVAASAPDAVSPADAPIDAVAMPIDAAVVSLDAAVAPLDARLAIRPGQPRARPDAAPIDALGPAAVLRPIMIGATPWAYFTIDGDPTRHETPMTLRLAVGAHRVTFSNPELGVSRTVTVNVPEEGEARHVEKMR
ncbi:MAG: protein kinase [Kofleriaceae bacterium]